MTYTRVLTTFTEQELELIETYAATRGIKKATAVKELAINHLMILSRGLELTTKPKAIKDSTELYNKIIPAINYINQEEDYYFNNETTVAIRLINKNYYLDAIKILNDLKEYTTKIDVLEALDSVIKDVSFYESNINMNNYLNKRN